MEIRVSQTRVGQLNLLVALVEIGLIGPAGDPIIRKLAAFFPHLPAMLVCVVGNGFVAHAPFQTHQVLALLQLEELVFEAIDLERPPEAELPF